MAVLQAAVIALVALILLPVYSFYFDVTPKLVVLLAGTAVILIIYTLKEPLSHNRASRSSKTWFSWLLLAYAGSLAVSTALSVWPALSLFGGAWRRFGSIVQSVVLLFAWLLYRTCAGRPERVRVILRGIVVAGTLSGAYGIAQFAGWDPILPASGYHVGEGVWTIVRPPGTFGYASYFATWLVFVVFLSIADYQMEESRQWRRLSVACAVIAAAAIVCSGTRAAILALAAGGLTWALFQSPKVTRWQVGAAVVVVTVLAGFYYSPPGQQLRSRARWFVEDPWGGARLLLWRDSLQMSLHQPAAGYGPEVFTAEFPRFESVALAQAYPDFSHESPHNIFLDVLVSQGIPGFLILCFLCLDGFQRAWRLKAASFAAALAGAVVSQQFTSFTMPTALIFFVTLALLAAMEMPAPKRTPGRGLVMIPAAIAACGLLYVAARLASADHTLAQVRRDLDQQDLDRAIVHYRNYQRYRLPGESADLWYSRRMLNIALHADNPALRTAATLQAEAAARKATETVDDRFNAWYNLAVISGLQNNGSGAAQCLRAAIAAGPNWYKPHWSLAQVLRAQGRVEEAHKEAITGLELDGGKHPEVTRTLTGIRDEALTTPVTQLQK